MIFAIAEEDLICSQCGTEIPAGASYYFHDVDAEDHICEECFREYISETI
jgi:hypothetical protein